MLEWLSRLLGRSTFASSATESASADASLVASGQLTREVEVSGVKLRIHDDTGQLFLDAPAPDADRVSATLAPRTASVLGASVLAVKAKAFDDGLYAAVELLVQQDGGKGAMLEALRRAHPIVAAACELGGGTSLGEQDVAAGALRDELLADANASKPLAFYAWSPALSRTFRQDRLLQRPFEDATELIPLARALHADPASRKAYERALRIAERLTNPLSRADLRPMLAALDGGSPLPRPPAISVLPPSVSHETSLIAALFPNRPIPDGFDLAREMMAAIRERRIDLAPKDTSGFYDRQTWSLETLVAPERGEEHRRVALAKEYREHLESLFRGLITLARETHIKQLEVLAAGCAMPQPPKKKPLYVAPQLTVEPLVTHYARRAETYRFVRNLLETELGAEALRTSHRLRESGPVAATLDEELAFMEKLFDGAAQRSRLALGLAPATDDAAERALARFVAERDTDVDVGGDVRTMVPVFYDLGRRKLKVWVFLGWSSRDLVGTYAEPPVFDFVDPRDEARYAIEWSALRSSLDTPVTAEVYTSRLLDRSEFRRLCDEHVSSAAILRALERL